MSLFQIQHRLTGAVLGDGQLVRVRKTAEDKTDECPECASTSWKGDEESGVRQCRECGRVDA